MSFFSHSQNKIEIDELEKKLAAKRREQSELGSQLGKLTAQQGEHQPGMIRIDFV